jgi:hypothetical protein
MHHTYDTPEIGHLPAHCERCKTDVAASVRFSFSDGASNDQPEILHHLATCPHCESILLLYEINFGGSDRVLERLYPPEDLKLHWCIPQEVGASFHEARICYRAGAFVACALMCRKTIEALYKVLGVKARDLYGGIKELNEKGYIEPGMLDWGNVLRRLGNAAAHDIAPQLNQHHAESILEFTFGLVEYALRFKPRFEKFAKDAGDNDK